MCVCVCGAADATGFRCFPSPILVNLLLLSFVFTPSAQFGNSTRSLCEVHRVIGLTGFCSTVAKDSAQQVAIIELGKHLTWFNYKADFWLLLFVELVKLSISASNLSKVESCFIKQNLIKFSAKGLFRGE